MRWLGSLRARVVLLVALILLPALGSLWFVSDAHHDGARRSAEARLAQLAGSVAAEYERLLVAVERLLRALSESGALSIDDRDACAYLLTAFVPHYDLLHGMHVRDADGQVWCAAEGDADAPPEHGDLVARAQRTGRTVYGPVRLSASSTLDLPVAVPFAVRDPDTGATSMRTLVAVIDLSRFPERSNQTLVEPGTVIGVFNLDGVMLDRFPREPSFIGRRVESIADAVADGNFDDGPYLVEQAGLDGVETVFANILVRPRDHPDTALIIGTGLPAGSIYANADSARIFGFLLIVVTALAVTGVSIGVSRHFMRTDIRPLVELTDRLARGDIPGDPPPYHGPEEFAELRDAMIASARAQRDSEVALTSALHRLDTYFRNSPLAFVELDAEMRVRVWTPQAEAVFGWTEAETLGKTPAEIGILHPDDSSGVDEALVRVLAEGGYIVNRNRNITRGGKTIWCEWHNSVLLDADGSIASILCVALDETEAIHAAQEVERRERQYRLLFAENPAPMWVFDRTSLRFLAVNQAAVDAYGWSEAEFRRMTVRDIRPEDERKRLDEVLKSPERAPGSFGIWRHLRKGGDEIQVEVTSSDIIWEGHAARIVVAHDVTGRERAKADLETLTRELEARVEARTADLRYANQELESFAYTVSHDLRSPLRSIDAYSNLVAEESAGRLSESVAGYLEKISEASQRMGMLIDDLLELSRVHRGEVDRQDLDLTALVADVIGELRPMVPDGRVIEISVTPGMRAWADRGLLRAALTNLLDNALKFTATCDPARIEVGCVQGDEGPVYYVRDNGVGFDMKYSDKLFGVFERLHGQDEFVGTGIGLATVQRIAHRHGGRVWAEGRPGEGATFWIYLPQGGQE